MVRQHPKDYQIFLERFEEKKVKILAHKPLK